MFRRRAKEKTPKPGGLISVGSRRLSIPPAPDPLRDQLHELVKSWQRTSGDLVVANLTPGRTTRDRALNAAQARILNTAAAELHALIKEQP